MLFLNYRWITGGLLPGVITHVFDHMGGIGNLIHIQIQIIMKCAEFQIVWMKGLIHLPGGTAVEFNRFGTNGLRSLAN